MAFGVNGAAGRGSASRLVSSWPWACAVLAMVCLIWGNSLLPGSESGGISLAVLDAVRGALRAWGLPYAWLTNFLVRKAAHFTEYAVLGVLVSQALDPRPGRTRAVLVAALALVAVPSIDETIQLFVPGRSGQVSDVLLDCCGAAFGCLLRALKARSRWDRDR